jgi:dCTP deaminase
VILSDLQIKAEAEKGMINPFEAKLIRKTPSFPGRSRGQIRLISYGLSSYGYDMRLGSCFGLYRQSAEPLDPLDVQKDELDWFETEGRPYVLAPKTFALAYSTEYLRIPRNVTAYVNDKSTYARVGIHAQNTVLEAGWEGQVTLELYNYLDRPVIVRPNQGVVQATFHQGSPCETSYADRGGKYQKQTRVTLPRA